MRWIARCLITLFSSIYKQHLVILKGLWHMFLSAQNSLLPTTTAKTKTARKKRTQKNKNQKNNWIFTGKHRRVHLSLMKEWHLSGESLTLDFLYPGKLGYVTSIFHGSWKRVIYERFKRTNSAPLVTIYTLQDKTVCVDFFYVFIFYIYFSF